MLASADNPDHGRPIYAVVAQRSYLYLAFTLEEFCLALVLSLKQQKARLPFGLDYESI